MLLSKAGTYLQPAESRHSLAGLGKRSLWWMVKVGHYEGEITNKVIRDIIINSSRTDLAELLSVAQHLKHVHCTLRYLMNIKLAKNVNL